MFNRFPTKYVGVGIQYFLLLGAIDYKTFSAQLVLDNTLV